MERINEGLKLNDIETKFNHNNIIFVYTIPKVGSTGLVSSLRLFYYNKYAIVHIHDETMLKSYLNFDIGNITIIDVILYNKELGRNVFVIDIWREPIELKISTFFEDISHIHFNNSLEQLNNYNIKRVIHRFNSIFPYVGESDHFLEKYPVIPPEKFDTDSKYILITDTNGIQYIKLRLCDSEDCWKDILMSIFKMDIVIIKDYKTTDKKIGSLFKKFKESYMIPVYFLDMIMNNKGLDYYYTSDEREKYINKWIRKSVITIPSCIFSLNQYEFYLNISKENSQYNNFDNNHYVYNGCLCESCLYKRKKVITDLLLNKSKEVPKIIHSNIPIKKYRKNNMKVVMRFK